MLFNKPRASCNPWSVFPEPDHQNKLAGLLPILAGIFFGLSAQLAVADNFGTQLADAFKDGTFDVAFRYRYEFVNEDSFGPTDPVTNNANASTLRTRLVYKTAPIFDTFLTLNMDDLRPVISSDFNDTRNGKTQYSVVADPKGTDLNLASLTYTGLEDGKIVLGRQRIIRENHRFIGNVGWRQNEQTYDSLSVDYAVTNKFQAFYSYIDRVKRIFGPEDGIPAASFRSKSHLLDASYTFSPLVRLTGYAYLLNFDNAASASSQTFGLRLTGKQNFSGEMDFSYAAEYASQQDYKDNLNNYDEGYYVIEGGLDWSKIGFKFGYEVLEGSGSPLESFQTPLATLHKFNGWADQFVLTPGGGIKDLYIQGTANILDVKFSLIYHDFSQQTGGLDYGSELDFVATRSFMKNYSVLAKFALFDVDSNSPIPVHTDINKFWLMLSATF